MIKKRYIVLTLVLSLIGMNKSYAACTQEQLNDFKLVESNYKVTYELNRTTEKYNVILHRDINNKYTYIIDGNMYKNENIYVKDNEIICKNISPGEYTIEIVDTNDNCKEAYKTITIKVPRYNKYSEDRLCEGIEEFYLCQETYEKEIDRETFESRINTYRTKKEKDNNKQEKIETSKEDDKGILEIIEYVQKNLTQVIIIAVFIILIIITTIVNIKQSRKSRQLE